MIYTVTFNPSLDYIVTVPQFVCGRVNRTTEEKIFPGGKGINVSMVLKNLGLEKYGAWVLCRFYRGGIKTACGGKRNLRGFYSGAGGHDTNQCQAAFRAGK